VLLRDRLAARLAEMGDAPDYQRLAEEILQIRNAPSALARQLVRQALVVEDRKEVWLRLGRQLCARAPEAPGVYTLRDESGAALYVGKAVNIRRRLRTHFADRRWSGLKAGFVRATDAEWREVGSELEALLLEATLIKDLAPAVNVQKGAPSLETRTLPATIVRDVLVVVPSVDTDAVELVSARADGDWVQQRTAKTGADRVTVARLWRFFHSPLRGRFSGAPMAPIVFSWLAGRGATASRLHPNDWSTPAAFGRALDALVRDDRLFHERVVMR
jgi:hypothetical protein